MIHFDVGLHWIRFSREQKIIFVPFEFCNRIIMYEYMMTTLKNIDLSSPVGLFLELSSSYPFTAFRLALSIGFQVNVTYKAFLGQGHNICMQEIQLERFEWFGLILNPFIVKYFAY